MAAIKPNADYKGKSFDRSPQIPPFFTRVLSDALAHINASLQLYQTTEDEKEFIAETGIDDVASDPNTMKKENSSPSENKIKLFRQIFIDHLDEIKSLPSLRPSILKNIERMIACGDPSRGGTMYACPTCDRVFFSPFHCGSRFCPSCGNTYNMKRANAMAEKVIDAPHRHVTFTLPFEMRSFYRIDRGFLDCLFTAVARTLYYVAERYHSGEHLIPGFICVLHTFGRDLKWNPHVHVLLCTKAVGDHGMQDLFLPYPLLRKSFQKVLLDTLKERYGLYDKRVNKLISKLYKRYPKGFYVNAPRESCNTMETIKYIGRYLGRPVIASSRIDNYDGKKVTFHYTRHEDDQLVTETIPALEFIKRLIVHIPDYNFKMVRYYGFYSSETAHLDKVQRANVHPLIPMHQRTQRHADLLWRPAMIQAFGVDPLKCSVCGDTMEPIYVSYSDKTYFFPSYNQEKNMAVRLKQLLSFASPSKTAV